LDHTHGRAGALDEFAAIQESDATPAGITSKSSAGCVSLETRTRQPIGDALDL
jgi:hypothetical protein